MIAPYTMAKHCETVRMLAYTLAICSFLLPKAMGYVLPYGFRLTILIIVLVMLVVGFATPKLYTRRWDRMTREKMDDHQATLESDRALEAFEREHAAWLAEPGIYLTKVGDGTLQQWLDEIDREKRVAKEREKQDELDRKMIEAMDSEIRLKDQINQALSQPPTREVVMDKPEPSRSSPPPIFSFSPVSTPHRSVGGGKGEPFSWDCMVCGSDHGMIYMGTGSRAVCNRCGHAINNVVDRRLP
ncbi:hypothetical protein SEA_SKOG_77 [Gordonia phage Skog]|uniref:Uncharacterized protein n=1 Tax=Gordonia phage Skog TaxID=2704033 RepID=A0A6G6XJD7_9CAUD|nr:hypothetical protein KHQ85_gp077 [Gordonia phage Skog]QIG58229.1 hypothetical protein SEA_SKOG_77 [Gordonia phage Skog]